MGRGNTRTTDPYESTTYVDYDFINVYQHESLTNEDGEILCVLQGETDNYDNNFTNWKYDEYLSQLNYNDFEENLTYLLKKRFPSLRQHDHEPLQNELFTIELEDNEWSLAVLLRCKDSYDYNIGNLQKRHHASYTEGIRRAVLEMMPSFSIPTSAWTSAKIMKDDYHGEK